MKRGRSRKEGRAAGKIICGGGGGGGTGGLID